MSSLVKECTQPYISKAVEVDRNANFKMAIVANNLRKFAIALEIIERHGLSEEYKKEVGS